MLRGRILLALVSPLALPVHLQRANLPSPLRRYPGSQSVDPPRQYSPGMRIGTLPYPSFQLAELSLFQDILAVYCLPQVFLSSGWQCGPAGSLDYLACLEETVQYDAPGLVLL